MTIFYLILIFIFLGISSYFSACETAISVASKARFHQMSKDGNINAKIIRDFQNNLGYSISVFISCNIALNAFGVALATKLLMGYLGEQGGEIAAALMSFIIVVYAEVMPKMLALLYAETLLLKSAVFLKIIFNIFRPMNHVIHFIAKKSVAVFGLTTTPSQATYEASIEELRGAIDLHSGMDMDSVQEKAMLKSILDLGSVTVGEIMVHRKNVTTISVHDSSESIVNQVLSSPFTRIPVWKDKPQNIVGVINAKALLRYIKQKDQADNTFNMTEINIEEIAGKPWFVPESTDLLEQLQAFRSRREHLSIIVDEYGELLGIVTLEDILEEIVGDISDEHDIVVKGIRPQKDGSYIIDGSVTIRDLNRQLNWEIPDEDASTIAGFVLYQSRIIPKVGQVFHFDGYSFEILRRARNQVTMMKINKID